MKEVFLARCVNLIDGGYFERVQKALGRGKIDFLKLQEKMTGNFDMLRTYYYHCLPYQSASPTEEEKLEFARKQSFFKYLEYQPNFEVRLGRLEFRGYTQAGERILEQKRVDLLIGVDLVMLSMKKLITHACIIAGDSDFIPAIEVAKYEGVITYLFHGPNCHEDLKQIADVRIEINDEFMDAVMAQDIVKPQRKVFETVEEYEKKAKKPHSIWKKEAEAVQEVKKPRKGKTAKS
jgi:uncharacterized LabA/DUF88 family protein